MADGVEAVLLSADTKPSSAWLLLSALGALALLSRKTPLGARLTG